MEFTGCSECRKYPTGKKHYDGRMWKIRFDKPIVCKECAKKQEMFAARYVCLNNDENMIIIILGFVSNICPKTMSTIVPHVCKWWRHICKTRIDVYISLKWSLCTSFSFNGNRTWSYIRDRNLIFIIDNFRGIRGVDLRGCEYLTETSLVKLTYSLTEFRISNSVYLSDEILNAILRTSPLLENLDLKNCNRLTDESLYQIGKCKHLNHINLIDFPKIKNETFVHILDSCRLLKSIKFEGCRGLSLQNLPDTKFLKLDYISFHYSRRMDDRGFNKMLFLSPNLSFLNIYNCNLFDELKYVAEHCLDLKVLFAQYNYSIKDSDISSLKSCKKLKLLNVSQTNCTKSGVDALKESIPGLSVIF